MSPGSIEYDSDCHTMTRLREKASQSRHSHTSSFLPLPARLKKPRTACSRYLVRFLSCIPSSPQPLYRNLRRPDSIRLLHLQPGLQNEEICCSFRIVQLSRRLPEYEALSYVLGTEDKDHTISVNGYTFWVRVNLHNALQRLRLREESRLHWVDAVCINQDDIEEKAWQVRMMGEIFKSAEMVLVWLGRDDHAEARTAFGILCALATSSQALSDEKACRTSPATFIFMEDEKTLQCPDKLPGLTDKSWISLMALLINPWFLRMWILQEIVLARQATFLWGTFSLPWTTVGKAIDVIRKDASLHILLESRNMQNASFMWHMCGLVRAAGRTGMALPFLHLLDWSRSFDVSDPRDKVYGLLGFATTKGTEREEDVYVEPDYALTTAEVYTHVARRVMDTDRNLDILSYATLSDPDSSSDRKLETFLPYERPSWVPSWESKSIIFQIIGLGEGNRFHAATASPLQTISASDPNSLVLKGVIVDTVTEALNARLHTGLEESTPHVKDTIVWVLERIGKSKEDVEVVAKTLTGGRTAQGLLITDIGAHVADFCALLSDLDIDLRKRSAPQAGGQVGLAKRAKEAVWRYTCYRSVFVTKSGKVGLGPGAAREGDAVVLLFGGQVPFVLRAEERKREWVFVGECYIEEWMEGGEGVQEKGKDKEKWFALR